MANSASARKRARQAVKRRQHNASMRSMYRTYIKRVSAAIESGNKENAEKAFKEAVPVIDSMARKNIVHKNKAARNKSTLNKHIHSMK